MRLSNGTHVGLPGGEFQPNDRDEWYDNPNTNEASFFQRWREANAASFFREEEGEPYRTIGGVLGFVMWSIVLLILASIFLFFLSAPFLVLWKILG